MAPRLRILRDRLFSVPFIKLILAPAILLLALDIVVAAAFLGSIRNNLPFLTFIEALACIFIGYIIGIEGRPESSIRYQQTMPFSVAREILEVDQDHANDIKEGLREDEEEAFDLSFRFYVFGGLMFVFAVISAFIL